MTMKRPRLRGQILLAREYLKTGVKPDWQPKDKTEEPVSYTHLHHAAVLGDDVSAEDDQCRFGNGPCGIQRIFPPVPALLDDVRAVSYTHLELADWAYANGEAMLIDDEPEKQDGEEE